MLRSLHLCGRALAECTNVVKTSESPEIRKAAAVAVIAGGDDLYQTAGSGAEMRSHLDAACLFRPCKVLAPVVADSAVDAQAQMSDSEQAEAEIVGWDDGAEDEPDSQHGDRDAVEAAEATRQRVAMIAYVEAEHSRLVAQPLDPQAQTYEEDHNHEIQEYDPVPIWFETEGHGTTRKQKLNDVRKGHERGIRPPKSIRIIAYNQSIAEAYSHAGKLAMKFGQEFPLLAAKKICIESGTASLIKLEAMLCIKCHYNDNIVQQHLKTKILNEF